MKLVLTSFGPFGGYENNPSEVYAKALHNQAAQLFPDVQKLEVYSETLPVDYEIVAKRVRELWCEQKPDVRCSSMLIKHSHILQLMVHLGVHPVDNTIHVERESWSGGYCARDINDVFAQA